MNAVPFSCTWAPSGCRAARHPLLRWLAAAALALAAGAAQAECSVSASGLGFAEYDVFSATPSDSSATITVSCSETTSYSLALHSANGSPQQPLLGSSSDTLAYRLHQDAARTLVWGEGAFALNGSTEGTQEHTLYGRIPEGQNVRVDSYTDLLTVTLEF
nr:spore coat U domain-containing protein [Halomonas sp. 1513]